MCVNMKSVINSSICDELVLDNYAITAIYIIRVLKRVCKDSRVTLAESVRDKMNDTFYNLENVTSSLVFLYFSFFFLYNPRKLVVNKRQQ